MSADGRNRNCLPSRMASGAPFSTASQSQLFCRGAARSAALRGGPAGRRTRSCGQVVLRSSQVRDDPPGIPNRRDRHGRATVSLDGTAYRCPGSVRSLGRRECSASTRAPADPHIRAIASLYVLHVDIVQIGGDVHQAAGSADTGCYGQFQASAGRAASCEYSSKFATSQTRWSP